MKTTISLIAILAVMVYVQLHDYKYSEPQISYSMDEKMASRCADIDEQTECRIKRVHGNLQVEKHVDLTDHQRLVLAKMVYPLSGK